MGRPMDDLPAGDPRRETHELVYRLFEDFVLARDEVGHRHGGAGAEARSSGGSGGGVLGAR